MNPKPSYTRELEQLIQETLLPAYKKYCLLTGTVDKVSIPIRRIPALLDKDFGVSVATSNVRKPRKN
jgi:hypothetical protein